MRIGVETARRSGRVRWPGALGLAVATLLGPVGPAAAQAGPTTDPVNDLVIRTGDVLNITVWPDRELGGEFPVEETGYVHLPIIGSVQAEGMQLSRLREQLREGYSSTLRNPVVTITPLFRVSVLGEVRAPSLYTISPTNTLFDVISMAGGFTPEANQGKIRVVRQGRVVEFDAGRALETGEGLETALQTVLLVFTLADRF
ncbi:MAG: polysaccharide biosynthesis/export family protein [Gemmatimonadota bacterium]